jgi:hypothetical protein
MVNDLVAYVVSWINIEWSAAINHSVAPKVLFTGMKVDFCSEFGLAFGDYCEVYDGTDNTSKPRSILCVALLPCNNAAGSWAFMNLLTKQRIWRSHWVKMVMTDVIISSEMNASNDADDGNWEQETGGLAGVETGATEEPNSAGARLSSKLQLTSWKDLRKMQRVVKNWYPKERMTLMMKVIPMMKMSQRKVKRKKRRWQYHAEVKESSKELTNQKSL